MKLRKKKIQTNDWSWYNPLTWDNIFEDPTYEYQYSYEVTKKNEKFNWNSDNYTITLSDIIEAKRYVTLDIVLDEGKRYVSKVPNGMAEGGLLQVWGAL